MWIMIGTDFLATTFWYGLRAFHHEGAAHGADGTRRLGLDGVFTIRIIGT